MLGVFFLKDVIITWVPKAINPVKADLAFTFFPGTSLDLRRA